MRPKRPPPRELEVTGKRQLTPHMLQVTLGGAGLVGFPADSVGGYVKLHLTDPNTGETAVRTYTVRHFDADVGSLAIDFVLHDIAGPAADWARNCKPGDTIRVGGPGPAKRLDPDADWVLIAGDMSALPAITANLEALPGTARGVALIEIIEDDDRQPIDAPEGVTIEWLVNAHPDRENTLLCDAVQAVDAPDGRPYYWVAGEFSQSLAIRAHLKRDRGATRLNMYASSYWQIGQTEDGHRVSKRNAAED